MLQIFIEGVEGIISTRNNFPIIEFETNVDKHAWINKLQSVPRGTTIPGGHFAINNPQLLPDDVRKRHMYPAPERPRSYVNDSDTDPESGSDDEYVPLMLDGVYPIKLNLRILKQVLIDNNSLEPYGFNDYVNPQKRI
jgi:hypothetical protein